VRHIADRNPYGPGWRARQCTAPKRAAGHGISRNARTTFARAGQVPDLRSRWGRSLAGAFPEIVDALRAMPAATLDGELIVPDREGRSDFDGLRRRSEPGLLAPCGRGMAGNQVPCLRIRPGATAGPVVWSGGRCPTKRRTERLFIDRGMPIHNRTVPFHPSARPFEW
jgi:hypothetical protein